MMPLAAAAALALAVAACAAGTPISGDSRNVGDVTVTFRIEPARVRAGQPVRLSLKLQNNSGREQSVVYTSGKRYDFTARRGKREVWRWSTDRAFTQAVVKETLTGQSGKSYSEVYRPTAAGRYRLTAVLLARGYEGRLTGDLVVQ